MKDVGEYISREAANALIKAECSPKVAAYLIDAVATIPAADVRPVVTCADCKFWDRERISCEGLARCNTGESGVRYRNRNDFCSRGKREEG